MVSSVSDEKLDDLKAQKLKIVSVTAYTLELMSKELSLFAATNMSDE